MRGCKSSDKDWLELSIPFSKNIFLFTLIYFQVWSLLHGLEILTIAENRKDSFQGLNSGLMTDSGIKFEIFKSFLSTPSYLEFTSVLKNYNIKNENFEEKATQEKGSKRVSV